MVSDHPTHCRPTVACVSVMGCIGAHVALLLANVVVTVRTQIFVDMNLAKIHVDIFVEMNLAKIMELLPVLSPHRSWY